MATITPPTAIDLSPFLTLPLGRLDRMLQLPVGSLQGLFGLSQNFATYQRAYLDVAQGVRERVPPDVLLAVSKLRTALQQCQTAAVAAYYYPVPDPDILALVELMTDVEDAVTQLRTTADFFGVEIKQDGSPVQGSTSYMVRQGDTLENVARRFLGNPEAWTQIARFNDINLSTVTADTTLASWTGRTIQIPIDTRSQPVGRDPAVLDAPIGVRALGTNWPLTLTSRTRLDGQGVELTTLDPVSTVLQGLSLRLETVLGSMPDTPSFGSYLPALIGRNFGEITLQMLEAHIRATLLADPRVSDVVHVSLVQTNDQILAGFQLRLFNGLTLSELWAAYNIRSGS